MCCRATKGYYLDTATVVSDLKEFEASLLGQDLQRSGPRINGVFYQFLECMNWSDNNLSGGDFVDYCWIKGL